MELGPLGALDGGRMRGAGRRLQRLGALLAIPIAAAIEISIHEYNAFRNPPEIGAIQAPPPEEPPPGGETAPAT